MNGRVTIWSAMAIGSIAGMCLGQQHGFRGPLGMIDGGPPSQRVAQVEFVDVDGDGDLDALRRGPSWVSVAENEGGGVFTTREFVSAPGETLCGFACLDMDGDGDADLLLFNEQDQWLQGSGVSVWRNDGWRWIRTSSNLPAVLPNDVDLSVSGDLDGDHDLDVVVVGFPWSGNRETVLLWNLGGFLFRVEVLPEGPRADGASYAFLGDIDGDADLDLFFQRGNLANSFYRNDGPAGFVPLDRPVVKVDGGWIPSVWHSFLIDADRDPNLDLLLIDGTAGYLALGTGPFAFARAVKVFEYHDDGIPQFGVEDLDGDGLTDPWITWRDDLGDCHVFWNLGTKRFERRDYPAVSPGGVGPLVTVDVDGDGDRDFVAIDAYPPRCFLNDGRRGFTSEGLDHGPRFAERSLRFTVVDLIGTRLPELLTFDQGRVRVFEADGQGGFSSTPRWEIVTSTPMQGGFASDYDQDGDLDLFFAGVTPATQPAPAFWLRNDGSSGFVEVPIPTSVAPVLPVFSTSGDLDGDGTTDIVVVDRLGNACVHRNVGRGVFDVRRITLPAEVTSASLIDVALGDVDGDGRQDWVFGTRGRDYVAFGDGMGGLSTVVALDGAVGVTSRIRLADFDGDSDLDVACAGAWSLFHQPDRLLQNDGRGHFTPWPHPWSTGPGASFDLFVGDWDLDGTPDIVREGPAGGIDWNDGTGAFHTGSLPDRNLVVAVDVDGDQDLDFVTTDAFGYLGILVNRQRELLLRAPLRLGKPSTFEMAGAANSPYVLMGGVTSPPRAIPGLGVIGFDPATTFVLRRDRFDAQGNARSTAVMPSDTNLLGLSLTWQVAHVGPMALGNLWTSRVTEL